MENDPDYSITITNAHCGEYIIVDPHYKGGGWHSFVCRNKAEVQAYVNMWMNGVICRRLPIIEARKEGSTLPYSKKKNPGKQG